MLSHVLSKKDFPIRQFLNELEKRELLFLLFLSTPDNEEEVDFIYQSANDVEHFFKALQKTVGTKIRKLPKNEIVDLVSIRYEDQHLTSCIYKNIYQHYFDTDLVLFNSKIIALERFTSLIFSRKIEQVQNEFLSGKIKIENRSNLLEEFQKRITYLNKPVLNTLGIISLLGKVDYALKNFIDSPIAYDFKESLICLLMEQFEKIEIQKIESLNEEFKKQGIALKNKDREIQKKDETILKIKGQKSQLMDDYKELKVEIQNLQTKKKDDSDHIMLKKLQNEIEKKNKEIEKQEKAWKKDNEQTILRYEKELDILRIEFEEIKRKDIDKTIEIKNMKQKLDSFESKTIESYLQEYIEEQGFTDRLYQYIEPLIEEYKTKQEEMFVLEEVEIEEVKKEQKVGYCLVENDIHYAVFPDGTKLEIEGIPETTYLGKWQFVKVDSEGTFKWLYGYKYDENERDYQIQEFGSVIYKDGEPYIMKAVWDTKKLEHLPSNINLKEHQVISVNSKGELLRFYRTLRHNLDYFMPSIKAKGQEVYYILKIFPNGMLLRDIETDVEEFKVLDLQGQEFKEQQILSVKDNMVVHVFYSSKFYTFSHFYTKSKYGIAELKNDMVFIRKMSGEVVIVNEIPERLQIGEGDIITVDEFNNYMSMKKAEGVLPETDERRKLQAVSKTTNLKKSMNEKIEVDKEVLIVGKITYENSYKMALFKKGYRADVVDGYEPWAKVKSALKGKDIVVVISNFVSHDNMWSIKEEVQDVPVLYPEYDGANRIIDDIEETLKKQAI